MQLRDLTNAIVVTLAVMITAGGASAVGSLVLCVGSDGHTDIEIALGNCCLTEITEPDGVGGEGERSVVDPCGGCADFELDATPLTEEKHRLEPPAVFETDASVELCSRLESVCNADHQARNGSPDLSALATVVLLT